MKPSPVQAVQVIRITPLRVRARDVDKGETCTICTGTDCRTLNEGVI